AGWALFGYWVIAMISPEAQTSEERAAAHGQPPFNAQEIIDQAKKTAAAFRNGAEWSRDEWKRHWREQRRHWRAHQRQWKRQWRDRVGDARAWSRRAAPARPSAAPYEPPVWAGYVMPVFSLITIVMFAG